MIILGYNDSTYWAMVHSKNRVRELETENERLIAENKKLNAEIEELKKRISELEHKA